MVKEIAWALVDYTKNNKKFEIYKEKKFTLKEHQKVRIEDLLQIFVDDLELVKQFLQFIIEEIGQNHHKELEGLTTINLHHRLLEYHLYSRQMNEKKQVSLISKTPFMNDKQFKDLIESFINKHDKQIEPRYILFLF
jgi:hypothetical protein